MRETDADRGPIRHELIAPSLDRIMRAAEAMHSIRAIASSPDELARAIAISRQELSQEAIDNPDLLRVVRLLAGLDGMHAIDWLRMRLAESQLPRRRPPPAVELGIRLKGLAVRRLVARIDPPSGEVPGRYTTTITTCRGDVASHTSEDFAASLEGAINAAGVFRDSHATQDARTASPATARAERQLSASVDRAHADLDDRDRVAAHHHRASCGRGSR